MSSLNYVSNCNYVVIVINAYEFKFTSIFQV